MSDIMSAIHDDIDEYLRLCQKYKEDPEIVYHDDERLLAEVNPYGKHAEKLKKREEKILLMKAADIRKNGEKALKDLLIKFKKEPRK